MNTKNVKKCRCKCKKLKGFVLVDGTDEDLNASVNQRDLEERIWKQLQPVQISNRLENTLTPTDLEHFRDSILK